MTKVEFGHQKFPDIELITATYTAVLEHNYRNNPSDISEAVAQENLPFLAFADDCAESEEERAAIKQSILEPIFERRIADAIANADTQKILYGPTFQSIGLTIDPFRITLSSHEGVQRSPYLVAQVHDANAYKSFLDTLTSEDVSDVDNTVLLLDVIQMMYERVAICYDLQVLKSLEQAERDELASHAAKTLSDFSIIAASYERLSLHAEASHREPYKGEYDKLDHCVKYWGEDLLAEYMVAVRYELLTPPEKQTEEGPVSWHEEGLQHNWDIALELIDFLESKDKHELAGLIRQNLRTSLSSVIAGFAAEQILGDPQDLDEYTSQELANLLNISCRLNGEEYDGGMLEEYTRLEEDD